MSTISLQSIIQLYYFSTSRRIYTFQRVLAEAIQLSVDPVKVLVQEALAHDEAVYAQEQQWAYKRKTGKVSKEQKNAQKRLVKLDVLVDRCLSGMRDGAEAVMAGADEDEQELVKDGRHFVDTVFPLGVAEITRKKYPEELVAVKAVLLKLKEAEMVSLVQRLGLEAQAKRLEQLAQKYEAAMGGSEDLLYGELKAGRAKGQEYLLRVVAKIAGLFDEPEGEGAKKRGQLLGPVMEQNGKIGEERRARYSVGDGGSDGGEEEGDAKGGEGES